LGIHISNLDVQSPNLGIHRAISSFRYRCFKFGYRHFKFGCAMSKFGYTYGYINFWI